MKMKNAVMFTMLVLVTISPCVFASITTDSFRWTLYDDFSNTLESIDKWSRDGTAYNLSTLYNFNSNGKMLFRSYATYQWGANCRYHAFLPEEDIQGIKADISLKDNYYPAYGTGRNVIGMNVASNLDVYMGFFSNNYEHYIQLGYRFNGEDIIPSEANKLAFNFEQDYEVAIVLDDSGRNLLFFLNNQLFDSAYITPGSIGASRFFVETDISSNLDTDFLIDNYSVLIPEPATMLLLGLGGLLIRKH